MKTKMLRQGRDEKEFLEELDKLLEDHDLISLIERGHRMMALVREKEKVRAARKSEPKKMDIKKEEPKGVE
jgi:DNA mismatch repair ATPase MutL